MRIRLTSHAQTDLESTEAFIRQDSPSAAVRTVLRVLEGAEGLGELPNLGRPGRVLGTRELVVSGTPFIVVYAVRQNIIWVLRVLHAASKWP